MEKLEKTRKTLVGLRNMGRTDAHAFAAQIEAESKGKPALFERSRELADPLVKALGDLSSKASIVVYPEDKDKVARNERSVLQAGIWLLNITVPLNENGRDEDRATYRLTNGSKTVEINAQGSTVVTFHGDALDQERLSEKDIRPDFVASTVDVSEFPIGGASSARLVSRSVGKVVVGAPLAAHSEPVQAMVTKFITSGTEDMANYKAPEYAQATAYNL